MKPITRALNARKQPLDNRDSREGIDFMGRWFTPKEIHATCKARMEIFDQLPKEVRDRVNKEGR